MKNKNPRFIREDLAKLLDHRGLLREVAAESGVEYKRIHELISKETDPSHVLGKKLEDWILCASLLALTREDLSKGESIPFMRLMRLMELRHRVSSPILKMNIEGVEELLGPVATLAHPTAEEMKAELEREQSYHLQAKRLIDTSISSLHKEIAALLKSHPNS